MDLTLTAGELMDASAPLSLVTLGRAATETSPAIEPREFTNPRGSYAISKIMRKADPELKALEVQRVALCTKHSRKDENDRPIMNGNTFDIENMEAFNTDFQALRSEQITLSGCRKITIDETAGANISPAEFQALAPFVVDEE